MGYVRDLARTETVEIIRSIYLLEESPTKYPEFHGILCGEMCFGVGPREIYDVLSLENAWQHVVDKFYKKVYNMQDYRDICVLALDEEDEEDELSVLTHVNEIDAVSCFMYFYKMQRYRLAVLFANRILMSKGEACLMFNEEKFKEFKKLVTDERVENFVRTRCVIPIYMPDTLRYNGVVVKVEDVVSSVAPEIRDEYLCDYDCAVAYLEDYMADM